VVLVINITKATKAKARSGFTMSYMCIYRKEGMEVLAK